MRSFAVSVMILKQLMVINCGWKGTNILWLTYEERSA